MNHSFVCLIWNSLHSPLPAPQSVLRSLPNRGSFTPLYMGEIFKESTNGQNVNLSLFVSLYSFNYDCNSTSNNRGFLVKIKCIHFLPIILSVTANDCQFSDKVTFLFEFPKSPYIQHRSPIFYYALHAYIMPVCLCHIRQADFSKIFLKFF